MLGEGQFVEALAVVNLGSGLEPVGPVAKKNPVDVKFENFFFVQCSFDLDCKQYLIEFPDKSALE